MQLAVKNSKVFQFADDTNLLCINTDLKELRNHVNADLAILFDWLCANRLSLNVDKTEFVIFRPPRSKRRDRITLNLNRRKIFESSKIKYLGAILDPNLSWKHHFFELRKKLNKAVGMIYKLRNLKCDVTVLKSIYYSLFHSQASYGLSAWGASDSNL